MNRQRTFQKSKSSSMKQLMLRKPIDLESGKEFNKTLTAVDLTFLGVGGIIGTGIFVLTGQAAAVYAGPAILISFIIAGIVSGFAALNYSEIASMIPASGSAYSYVYMTMGEFPAWIIGWDLILEYLVGAATVAVGLSGYLCALLEDFGIPILFEITNSPLLFDSETQSFQYSGAYINLPAFVIVLGITAVLCFGVKESARLNFGAVIIKLVVIILFIVVAAPYVKRENLEPFIPQNSGSFGKFGVSGIFQGATTVFFAYIGFDAVSTTAQECKNPQRDLPIGIMASLFICTVLYIIVTFILTGIVPYTDLNVPHPIAVGIQHIGVHWLSILVEFGAVAGLTSVLVVNLMSQPRIFYSMAKDGLMPPIFATVHPVNKTPYVAKLTNTKANSVPILVNSPRTSIGIVPANIEQTTPVVIVATYGVLLTG